jgi:hypothetical protein
VRPRQPVGSTDLQRFSSTEPVNGHTKDASNSWERIMKSFDSAASDAHLSVGSAVRKNEQVNLRDQFSLAEYDNLRMEILKMIETSIAIIKYNCGCVRRGSNCWTSGKECCNYSNPSSSCVDTWHLLA